MIARFTGATLGLLAFTVSTVGGLWVGNPVASTLSRAIWSLVIFCILGMMVGAAAQAIVKDHAQRQPKARASAAGPDAPGSQGKEAESGSAPAGSAVAAR